MVNNSNQFSIFCVFVFFVCKIFNFCLILSTVFFLFKVYTPETFIRGKSEEEEDILDISLEDALEGVSEESLENIDVALEQEEGILEGDIIAQVGIFNNLRRYSDLFLILNFIRMLHGELFKRRMKKSLFGYSYTCDFIFKV